MKLTAYDAAYGDKKGGGLALGSATSGDVSGGLPGALTVVGIQGVPVASLTGAADGDVLTYVAANLDLELLPIPLQSGGMVPYYIGPSETYTVPVYKQAPFAMVIDNQGSLVVDGFLIEVD